MQIQEGGKENVVGVGTPGVPCRGLWPCPEQVSLTVSDPVGLKVQRLQLSWAGKGAASDPGPRQVASSGPVSTCGPPGRSEAGWLRTGKGGGSFPPEAWVKRWQGQQLRRPQKQQGSTGAHSGPHNPITLTPHPISQLPLRFSLSSLQWTPGAALAQAQSCGFGSSGVGRLVSCTGALQITTVRLEHTQPGVPTSFSTQPHRGTAVARKP